MAPFNSSSYHVFSVKFPFAWTPILVCDNGCPLGGELTACFFFFAVVTEEKPEVNESAAKEVASDDLDFEDAREENDIDFGDNDEDDDDEDDEQLMVIETPEGLTLVEPTENSSFYIVQENEGEETPPGIGL